MSWIPDKLNGHVNEIVKFIGIGIMVGLHYAGLTGQMAELKRINVQQRQLIVRLVAEGNQQHKALWAAMGYPLGYHRMTVDVPKEEKDGD